MNKLYKCALGLLTTFILSFTCYSSAESFNGGLGVWNNMDPGGTATFASSLGDFACVSSQSSNCSNFTISLGNNSNTGNPYQHLLCVFGNLNEYVVVINNNTSSYCPFYYMRGFKSDFEDNICSTMSSLECQTEYNLIPIEEVTANYCRLNFDLIDPQECPINSGTGAIVRSNLMINDIPYAQNQNINVFIPDFLNWNIAFNDFNTVIDIEGYNADEEYIENVINQEKLTPTNEDIEEMITGFMTNYFPYLALAIVFLYLARKIFKLFK